MDLSSLPIRSASDTNKESVWEAGDDLNEWLDQILGYVPLKLA
jgi:hypothetical protein